MALDQVAAVAASRLRRATRCNRPNLGRRDPDRPTRTVLVCPDRSVTRIDGATLPFGDHSHVKHPSSFRCVHCRLDVPTDAPGTAHRNHCPNCLWSRHLDVDPGDRASDCLASMEPIAITVRKDGRMGPDPSLQRLRDALVEPDRRRRQPAAARPDRRQAARPATVPARPARAHLSAGRPDDRRRLGLVASSFADGPAPPDGIGRSLVARTVAHDRARS